MMEEQPMYLQRMVCIGMHVLCCLGTQDISTPPDQNALTVHLSNKRAVKFMDEKRNVFREKTYSVDMCFQWDRDVFGRAVEMLGRQQGHLSAGEMEVILRAMAGQSTDTERAHVHDTRGAVEVQWDRDKFARAVKMLGGQQSKVDGEEVEAILHAMAYQSTGKVDIVHVSGYMKKVAKYSEGSYEITRKAEVFDKA
eukprot:jgi/Antlo1/2464/180